MAVADNPERYKSLREREIERRRANGEPFDMQYADLQEFLDPFYRNYFCADGRPFYVVSASHTLHPLMVLDLLGVTKQVLDMGVPQVDAYQASTEWPPGVDCTLASYPLSKTWSDRIAPILKEAFLHRSSAEWETLFGAAGAPGCAQQITQEWLNSEHALASGLVAEVDDPVYGRMRQAGSLAWLQSDADKARHKPASALLDFDRATILEELRSETEAAGAPASVGASTPTSAWLDGLTILDLTNVIAGPTVASTLARFGAEVISLDAVKPTFDPWNTIIFGLQANRGKRSLLVNLKTTSGQAILSHLLARVDVVVVNALDKQPTNLGLSWERLQIEYPNVILCQLDAFGGPARGPRSDFPGYDDLAQAAPGVMARFGGSLTTPEEHAHFGTIDVLGGFCAALATAFALVKQGRGGGADVARSSLAAAGQLIQLPFMYDYANRGSFDEPSGRAVKGWHALYRCYPAQDGWFLFGARQERLPDLATIPELGDLLTQSDSERELFLEAKFKTRPRAYWLETLQTLDVGAYATESLDAVRTNNLFRESTNDVDIFSSTFAFVRHDQHPSGRAVDLYAPNSIRPHRAQVCIPTPAPKYGAHTRSILAELGYTNEEIGAFVTQEVVAEQWSDVYMLD